MKGRSEGSVPITRRFLITRPVRTAAGAGGIGLALMLMLLLAGLWLGVQDRVTTYDDHLGADLVVVPPGTRNLFADPGVLPAPAVDAVAQTPGVTEAAPLRTMYQILELPHGKAAVAAVAYDPTSGLGGPWAFGSGRAPETADEFWNLKVGSTTARQTGQRSAWPRDSSIALISSSRSRTSSRYSGGRKNM